MIINGENRSFRLVGTLVISAGRRCNSNDGGHYSFRIHRENDNNKNKKGDNHQKKTIKRKTRGYFRTENEIAIAGPI
jgi:hypothetical protein